MTKSQYRIKVNKIPLENKVIDTTPQVFPRMPRLYLEVIENKTKVKQDLINKEYVPSSNYYESTSPVYKQSESKPSNDVKSVEQYSDDIDDNYMKDLVDKFKDAKKKGEYDTVSISSDDTNNIESYKEEAVSRNNYNNNKSPESTSSEEISDYKKTPYSSYEEEDVVTSRLKALLADTDSEKSVSPVKKQKQTDKYSRSIENYKSPPSLINQNQQQPPSLAELEAKGMYQKPNELRDIGRTNLSEREEEDLKREYLFKFEILKKSYKEATIPEYSIHTDLNTLEKSYESTVRSLSLDGYVDYYKKILIGAFMLIEYALGKWGKFDMEGYTKQQIVSMNSYEQLLIELGEKSYRPAGTGYPIELRLLGLIIMNTAIFLFSKMLMKNTGANLMSMLNIVNTPPSSQKKRKMRGPDINLNDIPDLDEIKSTSGDSVALN